MWRRAQFEPGRQARPALSRLPGSSPMVHITKGTSSVCRQPCRSLCYYGDRSRRAHISFINHVFCTSPAILTAQHYYHQDKHRSRKYLLAHLKPSFRNVRPATKRSSQDPVLLCQVPGFTPHTVPHTPPLPPYTAQVRRKRIPLRNISAVLTCRRTHVASFLQQCATAPVCG